VASAILGNTRQVSVYTPPGYDKSTRPNSFLMIFDGDVYQSRIPTPTIMDNLIAKGLIPPTVVAFIFTPEGGNRNDDLTPNQNFQDFLARELMPLLNAKFRISASPAMHTIAGSSRGGLVASYSALCHSELFGNVISLSGSYWWSPGESSGELVDDSGWLIKQYAESPSKKIKFYMDVGTWEGPGQVLPNRILQAVLKGKGCDVVYREFPGSHAPFNWVQAFPEAIVATLGFKTQPTGRRRAIPRV
jgi:enterochelin esterase family protein